MRPRTNTFSAVFSEVLMTYATSISTKTVCLRRHALYNHERSRGRRETFRVTTLDIDNPPRTEDGKDYTKDFGREFRPSASVNLEPFAHAFEKFTPSAELAPKTQHSPPCGRVLQVEPEIAFCARRRYDVAEEMSKYVISLFWKTPDEMAFFDRLIEKGVIEKLEKVVSSEYARVRYNEAVRLLQDSGAKFDISPAWGGGIQTEHERYLCEHIFKRPVFVTDYPKEIKAFYMRQNDDQKTVAATDLLFPGIGEVVGGSQREERYEKLLSRIEEMGLNKEEYWWYLDLRKYGHASTAAWHGQLRL